MSSSFDFLFPTPAAPPNLAAPARSSGITPQTVETLKKVLKDNYERWHIFFNDRGFHNHVIHHALALWALGADGAVIEAGYKIDSKYQRATYSSPSPITNETFKDHLGKAEYWDSYLKFFSHEIRELGMRGVLEKYIFSREFNFDNKLKDTEQPRMLDRFVAGLLHPVIHTGYGYEFGLPGIVAEGLASTALHQPRYQSIVTPELFDKCTGKASGGLVALAKELDITATAKPRINAKPTHALNIIARLLKDERLAGAKHLNPETAIRDTTAKFGHIIGEHLEQWDADTSDAKEVTRKFEELVWTTVAIYGVCGFQQDKEFKNDFFYMHLVTSVLFLPSLLAYLPPPSQALFLRAYFGASIVIYIARGRPNLDIKSFYASQRTLYPIPTGALPIPDESTLPQPGADPNRVKAVTPNPWLPIIETSLTHPNEHLIKLQRALAHFSALLGSRSSGAKEGGLEGAAKELEGAELLDGTLFIRVAGLTAKRMGRVREGEVAREWDFSGFYAWR